MAGGVHRLGGVLPGGRQVAGEAGQLREIGHHDRYGALEAGVPLVIP